METGEPLSEILRNVILFFFLLNYIDVFQFLVQILQKENGHITYRFLFLFENLHLNSLNIYHRERTAIFEINKRVRAPINSPPSLPSLLGMRQMRMPNMSRWVTSCYYPSWKHSQSPLSHYTIRNAWCMQFLCRSRTRDKCDVVSTYGIQGCWQVLSPTYFPICFVWWWEYFVLY